MQDLDLRIASKVFVPGLADDGVVPDEGRARARRATDQGSSSLTISESDYLTRRVQENQTGVENKHFKKEQ